MAARLRLPGDCVGLTHLRRRSQGGAVVSLLDAINKQLGLKLVMQKRPVPALVIDHIDEKPTEN